MVNQQQHVGGQELENCSSMARQFVLNLYNSESATIVIIINIVVNVVLMITASLGNGMIIVAILRSQNLQTPSYLLITSLAFTDLLMGLVFHPLHIVVNTYNLRGDVQDICAIGKVYVFFATYLGAASLLMVACISIDRYLALTLRHRYNIIVTKKRVRLLNSLVWIKSFFLSFLETIKTASQSFYILEFCLGSVLILLISIFYIKSFRALHLYTVQVQAQQPNPLAAGNFDVVRYKKTLKTMVIVLGCLLLCSVPILCTAVVRYLVGSPKEVVLFHSIALTAFCLNSSINPVIYLVRFADIRHACRERFNSFHH